MGGATGINRVERTVVYSGLRITMWALAGKSDMPAKVKAPRSSVSPEAISYIPVLKEMRHPCSGDPSSLNS